MRQEGPLPSCPTPLGGDREQQIFWNIKNSYYLCNWMN